MISVILVIFIAVLTVLSAIISSHGPLYDLSKKGIDIFTVNGKLVIIMGIAIIALSAIQVYSADYQAYQAKLKANIASERRDSVLRADYAASVERIRSNYEANTRDLKVSYDSSTTNIVTALARYGLKYDSARQRIEKLVRDSTSKPLDLPFLALCSVPPSYLQRIKEKEYSFTYKFCNTSAFPANGVVVRVLWFHNIAGKLTLFRNDKWFDEEDKKLSPNAFSTIDAGIKFLRSAPDLVYCFIYMEYKNSSGVKYSNSQFVSWDLQSLKSVSWEQEIEKSIRAHIKINKLI